MNDNTFELWTNVPGMCEETPTITAYVPKNKTRDCAVLCFAGGAYNGRAAHEDEEYARFFNDHGITAFTVVYRVNPHRFPAPLQDARRAVQWVRHHAAQYGIDKDKIAVIGSSAGGHLTALLSTYFGDIDCGDPDEIGKEDFIPNAQILCYPVIRLLGRMAHVGSGEMLLGDKVARMAEDVEPDRIVSDRTPPAFIWHTMTDEAVPVAGSVQYAGSLHAHGVSVELHVFPDGPHGMGLCVDGRGTEKERAHNHQWTEQVLNWLEYIGF